MTIRQDRHAEAHRRMLVAVSLSMWSEAAEAATAAARYCHDAGNRRRLRERAANYRTAAILHSEVKIDQHIAEVHAR